MLTVPNEGYLVDAAARLRLQGINHEVFYEADLGDEPTALATEPVEGEGRKVFADYPLLK